jgi:xanthine dehydrogenase YagT iron-sulfur-binding subunit
MSAQSTDAENVPEDLRRPAVSRRLFLRGAGGVAAGSVLANGLLAGCATRREDAATSGPAVATPAPEDTGAAEVLAGEVEIELDLNGARQRLRVEPRTTLLSALRSRCEPPLTGTKSVCERGNCGACTVLVDGRPAYACLLLAVNARGRQVRTIEGVGTPERLAPLQQSFCDHDASMCGFCTPGFVMSITACLEREPHADLEAIRRACAGNVCRCGTYPHVFAAALAVARGTPAGDVRGERKGG